MESTKIESLFHYTDFNAMRGIIVNGEIWLWNLRRMNDSQEMQYFITELKAALRKKLPAELHQKMNTMFSENLKDFNSISSYAACFSEYSDDAAQWARYAKNGMGVCIEFDKEMLEKIGESAHTPLCKVNYSKSVEDLEIVQELANLVENEMNKPQMNADEHRLEEKRAIFNKLITSSPLFKHPSFISEKEYRLVSLPYNAQEYLGKPHFFVEENNIKKYYILPLKEVCKNLGYKYSDLFRQIFIGPQARVTKDVLADYFESSGMDELTDRIKISECPLRRF